MSAIGHASDRAPAQLQLIPSPRLRRQVWLRTASGQRLAYATSWWEAAHVDEYLQNRAMPIWTNLAQRKVELYRDIQAVYLGHSETLAAAFGEAGLFGGGIISFGTIAVPLR